MKLQRLSNTIKPVKTQQSPMSWIAFNTMRIIMSVRKKFRNIKEEIELAGIKEGDIVLDYGCGLGYNTLSAAKSVGKNGKVVALDISPQAINIVKKKAAKKQLTNIEAILPDCLTGKEDAFLDIVYLHNTLPLVHNKKETLLEISKLLKPGGKLSYVSRIGSRIYGNNSISDSELIELLKTDFHLILIKEKKGHLIFEKQAVN